MLAVQEKGRLIYYTRCESMSLQLGKTTAPWKLIRVNEPAGIYKISAQVGTCIITFLPIAGLRRHTRPAHCMM